MVAPTKKINAAKEQLEDGIRLFLNGRYLSALTLLGAAEEVLLRLIDEKTGVDPIESEWKHTNARRTRWGKPHISKRELRRISTRARNWLKHHTPGEPSELALDRFADAFHMIQRAMFFADQLQLQYKNKAAYQKWITKNMQEA